MIAVEMGLRLLQRWVHDCCMRVFEVLSQEQYATAIVSIQHEPSEIQKDESNPIDENPEPKMFDALFPIEFSLPST